LIVGHPQLFEIIEAAGGTKPFADEEYDNLFLVTIKKKTAKVRAMKYGTKSKIKLINNQLLKGYW
jgi:hypothetical protein